MNEYALPKPFTIVFSSFFAVIIFLLQGCNEKPTDISETLLSDTVSVGACNSDNTLLITGDKQEKVGIPIFNAQALFVGKYKEYEAFTFIRFPNLPDSLSYIREKNIVYAKFKIYPGFYSFGDTTTNQLGFDVHKIVKLFTNLTTYDSISQSAEPYWDVKILANYSGKINPHGDTLDPLELELDKSIISEWAASVEDSIAKTMNYGIALIPKNESSYIRFFNAQAIGSTLPRPQIEIAYLGNDNESHTITLQSANDLSVVSAPKPAENMITVQGAISYKSRLYFDVSMLPPLVSIHHAELVLSLDASKSEWGNSGADTTIQADLLSDTTLTSSVARQFQGERIFGTNKYVFKSIAAAIETWNRREGKGFLVLSPLGSENIYRSMERMVFYGTNESDTSLRPFLKIVYSQRPDFNKNR